MGVKMLSEAGSRFDLHSSDGVVWKTNDGVVVDPNEWEKRHRPRGGERMVSLFILLVLVRAVVWVIWNR